MTKVLNEWVIVVILEASSTLRHLLLLIVFHTHPHCPFGLVLPDSCPVSRGLYHYPPYFITSPTNSCRPIPFPFTMTLHDLYHMVRHSLHTPPLMSVTSTRPISNPVNMTHMYCHSSSNDTLPCIGAVTTTAVRHRGGHHRTITI